MSYILLPVSIFIKQINDSSFPFFSELPIYIYIIIMFILLLFGKFLKLKYLINKKVTIYILIVLLLQLISMFLSNFEIGNSVTNRNPLKEFIKLNIFFLCIYIHYIVVKMCIGKERNIIKFIQGNGIALVILLLVTYIQFFYLFLPQLFTGIVSFIGEYFENRYDRSWYDLGSYVQTLHRINGFNPESDYLAIQFLVIFIPFLLGAIKNKVNIFSPQKKYSPTIYYLVLLSIIIILFFAQTTTGILSIFLILFFLWLSLPIKRKIISATIMSVLLVILFFFVTNNTYMMEILNKNLFNKAESDSSMNRIGGTIGLIITWFNHFFIGVGWNFHNFYLLNYVPQWTKSNGEFLNVFSAQNFYPILSVFFGWLAEFGTIAVMFLIIYTYKLLRDFRKMTKSVRLNSSDELSYKIINTISDSAHFFVIFYLISSLFVFYWSESCFLIMFFFFIVVRQHLNRYSQRS